MPRKKKAQGTKKKATRDYEKIPAHDKEYNDRKIYHQAKEDGKKQEI